VYACTIIFEGERRATNKRLEKREGCREGKAEARGKKGW